MGKGAIRLLKGVIAVGAVFVIYWYIEKEIQYSNTHLMSIEVLEPEVYDELIENRVEEPIWNGYLRFEGETVAYDKWSETFYISQSMDTEEWKGTLSVSNPEYTAYFLEDYMFEDKKYAIETGYAFPLLLVSDDTYMVGNVVFTGLPTISLYGSADDSLSEIVVCYPGAEKPEKMIYTSNCKFHVRGSASVGYNKKNFRISLCDENLEKKKASLLGMRKDDDWVLNAMYTDSSKVREKVGYKLWEDMNALEENPVKSTNIEYVELFLNNSYHGLYGLMVPIDGKLLGMEKGDILYKVRRWELPDPANFDLCADMTDLNNFDGGRLVSIKYPQSIVEGYEWDPLEAYIDQYMWPSEIEPISYPSTEIALNIDNVVLYYWYYQMLYATDNGWKNIYLIAGRQEDGTYLLSKTAWDLNYSFGDIWDEPIEELWTKFSMPTGNLLGMADFDLLKEENPKLINALSAEKWNRWKEAGINADYIGDLADEYIEKLWNSGAMERDALKWTECKHDRDASEIRMWAEAQFEFLDTYMTNLTE